MRSVLRLLPIVATRRGLFIETVLWSVVTQAAVLTIALGLAIVVGRSLTGEPVPHSAFAGLIGLGVVASLTAWRESWVSHDLAYGIIGDLRTRVFDALRRALPARVGHRRSGDLATTVMADIETLEWLYAHTAAQLLSAVLVLATSIAVSATISPLLLLIWLPLLAVGVVVPLITARRAHRDSDRLAAGSAALRAELLDTVRGLRELISADALGGQVGRLAQDTEMLARTQVREAGRLGAERGIADVSLALATIGTILIVVFTPSAIMPVDIPLALTVAVAGLAPAAQIADLLRNTGTLRAAADRIVGVLATPPAITDRRDHHPAWPESGLVFDRITFSYDGERPVLADMSLHIRPGEIVALTGPSGVGKTTTARLAQRLWDPDAGSVRVDGTDLRDLTDDELRVRIAVVPQSSPLLRGTIRSNIILGDPGATADMVDTAAHAAGLLRPESALPLGLDTPVGEHGSGLSGGQRARVAIARALLRDPQVLVLDEATASLDPEADAAMMEVVNTMDDRAVLLVAHRPATIAAADRVVELKTPGAPSAKEFSSVPDRTRG
ncbi:MULTISPECIES: ABC transporter ATP-binding protein [unclassified Microbacterium]|uniref:ABC transporter ATP-binding protein n=1 Tax=unclassified Microbacterium TaxID=2609290 RepID=UPI0016019497|nr:MULTISPECIES: ABC transporter ATP-binding protein [unclassified Microbacterium]MBT2484726.1 ABC transporter ATP-binding protein [Microbacterium sp. ISL-108]